MVTLSFPLLRKFKLQFVCLVVNLAPVYVVMHNCVYSDFNFSTILLSSFFHALYSKEDTNSSSHFHSSMYACLILHSSLIFVPRNSFYQKSMLVLNSSVTDQELNSNTFLSYLAQTKAKLVKFVSSF